MRSTVCRNAARCARAVMLSAPVALAACNSPTDGGVACTTEAVAGIRGSARDANTGADITGGAYLVATEATFKDSVGATGGLLLAARERPGIYSVRIGHPGYFAQVRNNVVVAKDECHVIPVSIQERLVPAPSGPT